MLSMSMSERSSYVRPEWYAQGLRNSLLYQTPPGPPSPFGDKLVRNQRPTYVYVQCPINSKKGVARCRMYYSVSAIDHQQLGGPVGNKVIIHLTSTRKIQVQTKLFGFSLLFYVVWSWGWGWTRSKVSALMPENSVELPRQYVYRSTLDGSALSRKSDVSPTEAPRDQKIITSKQVVLIHTAG